MHITSARWLEVLVACGVRASTAARWAGAFEQQCQPGRFSLGRQEMDDFLAQTLYETGRLEHLTENLNYSAPRLVEVWPGRFPTVAAAQAYAYNPEKLAEKAYGGRSDLGNSEPGDGWRYIGRGIPHVTGRANYALLEGVTGEPLVDFPVLLEHPDTALKCGIAWWEAKVPDSAIDTVDRVSRAVNGGKNGLVDRRAFYRLTNKALA